MCRRIGGAFGGKASRSMPVAVAASIAAAKLGRPVRLVLNRNEDFRQNAGEHMKPGRNHFVLATASNRFTPYCN